ncbi:uncharacterized protein LOC143068265 [Mytilus galloprovincialis]|uniref:uncharacterized protein LOC143068265 n=1 Tax=Mytilus galloprovincialis TaxID=29158 RepID=UPI003F7C7692
MILNGDNVTIECNVESYIPVRSVSWQKVIDGEIIQIIPSENKYKMDYGKRPSLTLTDFNADDQGKYRCIVRNYIGLRNEMFVSCRIFMSRFGWLTRFVTVLQHIPAFHTEDITLHNYDIDSQSKPTVYNVYKGDDITMEQHSNAQQKLVVVKWFKESDKGTELDRSNEQYSGGFPEVPSLTIKATTVENAGKYFCLLIYDNEDTQKAFIFKLKIIPQVKIYKALCEHRENKTFIRPAIFESIDKQMKENNIVVITGREGTGKSKICLELASIYDDKDYMVLTVDLSENYTIYTDIANALLIIDDNQSTQDSLNTFMKHLLPVMIERNIKVILSCRYLDLEIVSSVSEIIPLKGEPFIDMNSCLTPEEKEEMLRRYIKENNIGISAANVSNLGNPDIITDLSVQVKIADEAIKVIRNKEPWKGFPLCASLFCSKRKFLHLGEKYFTNPPTHLVEELKKLYEAARKPSNCRDKINDYCILVYIMNNKNHQLDLNDPNLCSQLDVLYQTFFSFKNKPEKPGSNEDKKKAIEEAVHRMNNKYLKFQEGVYEFIHPCLLKAMFLSSDSMVHFLLQNGSLHDITELVRSEHYTGFENELVIKIDENYHHILCEKLVGHALENHSLLQHVAEYIYSYWRLTGDYLVNKMFKHIECLLFRSLEVHTDDILSHDTGSLSESSINLEGSVQFSKIIILLDELTYKGRDPWIYGPGSADFLILSALISAAIGRYATNRRQTFNILLEEFRNRIHSKSFVNLWSKPLDMHGNTFFHYLMLFCEMEATYILNVNEEERPKYVLDTENVKKYTPLDIAVFLGKRNILEVLNLTNVSKKLRDRLNRLAESGKVECYYENSKHKNIDQPMVNQVNDDSDSPKKHEYEDVNDVKKGVKDEVKKNKSFFKIKSSMKKEEPSEKEKHNKNNVLCFDDFMINIVVFGEKEDYKSILKLLS